MSLIVEKYENIFFSFFGVFELRMPGNSSHEWSMSPIQSVVSENFNAETQSQITYNGTFFCSFGQSCFISKEQTGLYASLNNFLKLIAVDWLLDA